MSYTPLASRAIANALPLILAGPILRHVDKRSVTVWLAYTGATQEIVLNIYDNNTNAVVLSSSVAGHVSDVKIGKNETFGGPVTFDNSLNICVITAKSLVDVLYPIDQLHLAA